MRRKCVFFGLIASLILAACAGGAGTARSEIVHVDPARVTSDLQPVAVEQGDETGVLEYFAAIEWLSEPRVEGEGAIRGPLSDLLYLDESGQGAFGRNNGRTPWWVPRFETPNDPYSEGADTTIDTHPVVSYDYACPDGRLAFVRHYVHDDERYIDAWKRPDFLGQVDHNPATNQATITLEYVDSEQSVTEVGYLRPTDVGGGSFAGAEYAITLGEMSEMTGIPLFPGLFAEGYLKYGFYQYFSFVDEGGTTVEVQIAAPSLDVPDGWLDFELEHDSPSILTGNSIDPLDFVDHDDVEARFDCGAELANRLAPVIAALNTDT